MLIIYLYYFIFHTSECYLLKAIDIAAMFLPDSCPIIKHLFASFKRNCYSNSISVIVSKISIN